MKDRDRSSSGIVELRNQTQQSRVIQVDLEILQQPSGILGVRTNTKYWVSSKVNEGQRINPARVLWSCATRHISWESSKSIWKDCSNFRVFSGFAQMQNTEWSMKDRESIRLGFCGVAQPDTSVESRPSWFGKTAATFGYSRGTHKHKIPSVVEVGLGIMELRNWTHQSRVVQVDFEKLPHTYHTHLPYPCTLYTTSPLPTIPVYSTMSSIDNQFWVVQVNSHGSIKNKDTEHQDACYCYPTLSLPSQRPKRRVIQVFWDGTNTEDQ